MSCLISGHPLSPHHNGYIQLRNCKRLAGAETIPGDSSRATIAIPGFQKLCRKEKEVTANNSPPVSEASPRIFCSGSMLGSRA